MSTSNHENSFINEIDGKYNEHKHENILKEIIEKEGNDICADCNSKNPQWTSIYLGILICTQCAGVHRSFGVHISFVLSLYLDKLNDEQLNILYNIGNILSNNIFEYHVPTIYKKPTTTSTRDIRETYILSKYDKKLFHRRPNINKLSPIFDIKENIVQDDSKNNINSFENNKKNQIDSNINQSMVEYVGVLVIELLKGKNLAAMDINDTSDPYVHFQLGNQDITSSIIKSCLHPEWNETLLLSWNGFSDLIVEIFDHKKIRSDRLMGSCFINIKNLFKEQMVPNYLKSIVEKEKYVIELKETLFMKKDWANNFGEHMVAGAEGITKGFYRGITGVWKDPIQGAKESGIGGFAMGFGKGIAGIIYRPIQGFGTMVRQTAIGAKHLGKKNKVFLENKSHSFSNMNNMKMNDMIPAGEIHLKLSLENFQ